MSKPTYVKPAVRRSALFAKVTADDVLKGISGFPIRR
jgi:hypothetical protein